MCISILPTGLELVRPARCLFVPVRAPPQLPFGMIWDAFNKIKTKMNPKTYEPQCNLKTLTVQSRKIKEWTEMKWMRLGCGCGHMVNPRRQTTSNQQSEHT